jgi:hypothetical protein
MTDKILNRFCREILPIVNDKIERLDVLSSSVERIFHTINYPNLNTLGLYELEPEIAKDLFGGKLFSSTPLLIDCTRIIYLKITLYN